MPLVRHQIRRDTAANWTAANLVLLAGEPAFETDTGKRKTGDGIRNWASLPYDTEAGLATTTPAALGTAAAGTAKLAARADHVHAIPSAISTATIVTTGNVTVGGNLAVTGTLTAGTLAVPAASVTGLSEAVDDRVSALVVAGTGITKTYDDTANTLTLAVGTHQHTIAQVTNLQSQLDGKADDGHIHAVSDITNLQSALDGKQAVGTYASATHSHAQADVSGLVAALALRPTSDPSAAAGSSAVTNIVFITQAYYDALATKHPTTLYVIT